VFEGLGSVKRGFHMIEIVECRKLSLCWHPLDSSESVESANDKSHFKEL
jgi:hypothetical protein